MTTLLSMEKTLVKELARGSGGSTVNIYRMQDGCLWAGKELNKSNHPKWKNEIEILKSVGHANKNVIHYHSFDESSIAVTLLMELCDSNLEEYVRNKKIIPATAGGEKVEPKTYFDINAIEACRQAVCGIDYLHTTWRIIHRDIKSSNFLLVRTNDSTTQVKVSDFGISKAIPPGEMGVSTGTMGTKVYMAKECYNETWTYATDIFALGVLLYFVLSNGHHPFGDKDYQQESNIREGSSPKLNYLRNCDLPFTKEQKITACDLIKQMISKDPGSRLKSEDVLSHPTFWDSKRKVEFYKKVQIHLKPKITKKMEDLNKYDGGLLCDEDAGKLHPFEINIQNVPSPIREQKHHPTKCYNVQTLIQLIRNCEAHACDKKQSRKIKDCLGVANDKLDMDQFLEALTGKYPQLLAHLYEHYRGKEVATEFYARENPVNESPVRTIVPLDTPSTPAAFSNPLLPWEQFLVEKGIKAEKTLFEYIVTIKYNGATATRKELVIKNSLKLLYATAKGDVSTELQVRFPESSHHNVKTILLNCLDGIVLRTDPNTKSLVALRKCLVQVFHSCHLQKIPSKMIRETETEVMSFARLVDQLQKGDSEVPKSEVEFVFGIDPNTAVNTIYPVSVTVESVAAAMIISQHTKSSGEPTSILISY